LVVDCAAVGRADTDRLLLEVAARAACTGRLGAAAAAGLAERGVDVALLRAVESLDAAAACCSASESALREALREAPAGRGLPRITVVSRSASTRCASPLAVSMSLVSRRPDAGRPTGRVSM
jgi:hypothetical protein